jgi:hypothetical protein
MMKHVYILSLVTILTGCMSHNVQTYGEINPNEKTITVPSGSHGLKGKIKKFLSQDGWKISVYRGPKVTKGSLGENTNIEEYDTFNTRYNLHLEYSQYDWCIGSFDPALNYEVTLIDNNSGSEVIALSGRGCENTIVEKFTEAFSNATTSEK